MTNEELDTPVEPVCVNPEQDALKQAAIALAKEAAKDLVRQVRQDANDQIPVALALLATAPAVHNFLMGLSEIALELAAEELGVAFPIDLAKL